MRSKKLTFGLLVVYLAALVWIVLFKMAFSVEELPHLRSVNFVPFMGSAIVNGRVELSEIIQNVIAFIPFGVLIGMLWEEKTFVKKVLPVFLTSLSVEVLQYILAIGATDITDLITNTTGGIVGIGIFLMLRKLLKDKCNTFINVISLVCGILLIGFIGLLIIMN